MSHLIAEQVGGRVHFCHSCSVSVPEIMELERDTQLFLDFSCGVLHGVHSLNLAIGQTVDQIGGKDFASVHIFDNPPVLLPEGGEPHFILRSLPCLFLKVDFESMAHVDHSIGIACFGRYELD